jgi:hypothetical protein
VNALRRHPWVITCFFSTVAGVWVMLWTSLNGWWLPFSVSAVGLVFGVIGLVLWVRFPPPSS